MTHTPIAKGDLTWLNMDRPTNLMVVNGLLWFDSEPDWDAVRATVQERLIDRYEVLRRRPVRKDRQWVWEDAADFDPDRHVRRVTLPAPGDRATLQAYVSRRASQPMDRNHPLWEMDLIDGYVNEAGESGAATIARFHHSLADGIRIVQLVMGLCDAGEGATPPRVGRGGGRSASPAQQAMNAVGSIASDVASFAGAVGSRVVAAIPGVVTAIPGLASSPGDLTSQAFHGGAGVVAKPTTLTDRVTGIAHESNRSVNTWRSAARLALWGQENRVIADGVPGVDKRVCWIEGLELDEVKDIGKRHGATINDVLLSAVSLGMSHYLAEKGRSEFTEVAFMVPVSLKPVDASLPAELGNHFAMVMFPMPLAITETSPLLASVHSRMARIKNSAEATLVFGVQRAVAETPQAIAEKLTEYVADKTIGVITNVPGPRVPISLAGTEVAGILGFVPTASDQSLGMCILSYAGKVSVGVSADAGIMPDPDRFAELVVAAVHEMAAAA